MATEQKFTFDEVPELYDRNRPRYPDALFPGTGPFGPTCQNTYYRWCRKRCLFFLFPTEKEGVLGPEGGLVRNQNCLLAKSRHCPKCKNQKARSTGSIRGLRPYLGVGGEMLVQSELGQGLSA